MVKLISQGSYGCIFRPGFQCNGRPMKTNKYITKVLAIENIEIPIDCLPLLYLGKITNKIEDVIYFQNLDENDCIKIKHFFNYLYIKNPDISGGKRKRQTMRNKKVHRKRKTMKRVKVRRTRHRKRVNSRHSKKYI
jgi:hypothetical protein